ncbi:hypothetical protein SAMN05421504_104370 [Amycolatopsis xylanica]|uniref:Uncharacterized protein n=1 Tax=Amycolatopsis xylanica TaxID=589385 RepID=A0A1H3GR47_9PSEU|nr:hypothetical protein [Amycolatopsis xylanica]SDY05802.1 hypothetical protein SAMN05421504_104370 [Amycolatopsis xylanica]
MSWEYDGRHYLINTWSDTSRFGFGWELEDVAPTPGKGVVMEAYLDGTTGAALVRVDTDEPLPLALVERFLAEAAPDLAEVAAMAEDA